MAKAKEKSNLEICFESFVGEELIFVVLLVIIIANNILEINLILSNNLKGQKRKKFDIVITKNIKKIPEVLIINLCL
jgi:AAA15 family ATPase/GTPase